MSTRSELVNLEEIAGQRLRFRVPIYQRLYVWGDDQVRTLLEDLWSAYERKAPIFYVGGAIVIERDEDGNGHLELVDGQQRFTTLWMMSFAWGGALSAFCTLDDGSPRVTFAIRPGVDRRLVGVVEGHDVPPDEEALHRALARINSFAEREEVAGDLPGFLLWVVQSVQLVLTRVAAETDLNKLYEVINSRGQQLRHHEILKARLLAPLPATQRHVYAQLWEAASDMGAYVERPLKQVTRIRLADLVPKEGSEEKDFVIRSAKELLGRMSDERRKDGGALDLAAILTTAPSAEQVDPSDATPAEEVDTPEVRSILTFPMLLQHTLRVWLHQHSRSDLPRIADKDLLSLFEPFLATVGAAQCRSFIELLWELRYVFDKHVIKWVRTGEEEHLVRARLSVDKGQRQDKGRSTPRIHRVPIADTDAYTLLQAMLYHSQQITTHYWLTPFLAYLWRHRPRPKEALAYLRHLDNHLLCRESPQHLVAMSAEFLDDSPGSWHEATLSCRILRKPMGVGFPHYWFYKLEFVLWDKRRDAFPPETLRTFRITARNSVEHVSPQQPRDEDTNRVSDEVLDRFGNLALVSRSINSEYGNLPFNEKRQRFLNRNRGRADSLKLALIYQHRTWSDRLATQHEEEMTQLLEDYLDTDFHP